MASSTPAATACGATRAASTTRAPVLDGTTVNRDGGTMFGEYMCASTTRPATCRPRGSWSTRWATTSASRPLRHRLLQRRHLAAGADVGRQLEQASARPLGHHAGRSRRVLEVLPGLDDPDVRRRRLNGAPLPSAATSPTSYRLGDNPDDVDWKFEVRKGAGEYYLVENRQLVGLRRRPAGLRRDRLPRRRERDVHQQGQRRRGAPAGRRRRGRRQHDPEHLPVRRLGGRPVPGLQRSRRLHRRDRAVGDAVLRRPVRRRRCTSTAAAPTR